MQDNSAVDREEIKDNVKHVQGILLLSGCKEMDKISINNLFYKKNMHYSA